MFEEAELGQKISKRDFAEREPALHSALQQAQRDIAKAGIPVIVVVSGVEGAGKGEVVTRLHRWMDARGLETHAYWDETDDERQRPHFWRYWRTLPARGRIGILFGSWYTHPIIERVFKRLKRDPFDRQMERIRHFEQMLAADGTLIIKLWFHLSRKAHKQRLNNESDAKVSPYSHEFAPRYGDFHDVSARAVRKTDLPHAPWHIIEAENPRYRDMRAGEIILDSLQRRISQEAVEVLPIESNIITPHRPGDLGVLNTVDLTRTLEPEQYRRQLKRYQARLYEMAWKAHAKGIRVIAVFEGWDAGGKGGAIRRLAQGMDARLYRVISVAAPNDEERAHHYLWRFWRHVPRAGYHTMYDRSWYGRVLVERVEKFAHSHEWQRAYSEINSFEEQLVDAGSVLLKFWLHIDPDEQLKRFEEREKTPWKAHKITDEDWRNRERWSDYEAAVNDMVVRTSTEIAPWTLVSANDKRNARIEILSTYCEQLQAALDKK